MSNLLLPNLRQPRALSWTWPVKKTPSYSTIVQTPASRRGEIRISLTPVPVWNFEIDLSYIYGDLNQTNTAIQQLLDFYQRMQGAADEWLFSDPYDNAATLQTIGYGDGVTKQFQIGRSLGSTSFEPMQNVIPSLVQVAGGTIAAGPAPSGNQWYSGIENFIFYSQDFSQSPAWQTATSTTNTGGQTGAPDGTATATKIARLGSSGFYAVFQQVPLSVMGRGDTLIWSAWLKQGTAALAARLDLVFLNALGTEISRVSTGAITLSSSWTRSSISGIAPLGTVTVQPSIYLNSPANVGDFILGWGAQLERQVGANGASSYVATSNSAPVFPRGLITFAVAPALESAITVSFGYYYRCRFLDDEWNDLEEFIYQIWEMKSLKFRSVLL